MQDKILVEGAISPGTIGKIVGDLQGNDQAGGHSVFIGRVRADISGNRKVKAIEYSAYDKMVTTEADKITVEIYSEFPDVKSLVIIHSVGVVRAGEISLFVMASAGHRQQAIGACSKTVELIKGRLPVWKKEIFTDNSHEWKNDPTA